MVVRERVGIVRGETGIVTAVGGGATQGAEVEAEIARNMMVSPERDMLVVA
jgi:hypothetical protein